MITYGQEKYIGQAIEGVLMQETDFSYELVISNDSSPDNSDAVIKNYINTHPRGNVIKYVKHQDNLGAIPNFHFALNLCEGKYIAACEGDDYWTDPLKLQKQISFLEANPDYAASFHDVVTLYDGRKVSFREDRQNTIVNPVVLKDLLESDWLIPTCSFVFRSKNLVLPPFYKEMRFGDFILFCSVILNSKAYYMEEQMGVYRRNNFNSLTHSTILFGIISIKTDYIQFLNWLSKDASSEDQLIIYNRIDKEIEEIRRQIRVYRQSRFIRFYLWLRKILKIR